MEKRKYYMAHELSGDPYDPRIIGAQFDRGRERNLDRRPRRLGSRPSALVASRISFPTPEKSDLPCSGSPSSRITETGVSGPHWSLTS